MNRLIGVLGQSPFRVLVLALVMASAGGAGFWAGQQFGREVDNAGVEAPEPVTAAARTAHWERSTPYRSVWNGPKICRCDSCTDHESLG